MNKNTGGPAFPMVTQLVGYSQRDSDHPVFEAESIGGLTARDYFAAKAMQAIFASEWTKDEFSDEARRAFKMADAMLAERAK